MAGPLSTEEIEDVVSSVRRLVSNEQSSRRLSRDLNGERLLLTPALRVVSETSALAPLILEAPVEPPLVEPAVDAPSETDGAAELVEAEWEDEIIWNASEPVSLGEVALAAEEAEVLLPPAEDVEDLVAEVEELPEAWAEVGTDWVEDEPVPFVPSRRRAENLAGRPASYAPAPVDEAVDEAVASVVPTPTEPAFSPQDTEPAEAPDEIVPAAEPATTAERPSDPAERSSLSRMPTEIVDADGTPLAVVDEAALQEIVRQMIREELQGDLGERITRNVRKLVRAEINRALIARDLD